MENRVWQFLLFNPPLCRKYKTYNHESGTVVTAVSRASERVLVRSPESQAFLLYIPQTSLKRVWKTEYGKFPYPVFARAYNLRTKTFSQNVARQLCSKQGHLPHIQRAIQTDQY